MSFAWTNQVTSDLERWWLAGMSATEIRRELGGAVTRSAVLGKVSRLGLQRNPVPDDVLMARAALRAQEEAAPKPVVRQSPSAGKFLAAAIERKSRAVSRTLPASLDAADVPMEQRKALLNLTETTCRWPYGDVGGPEFFFCGAETGAGPYCAGHARTARQGG